MGPKYLTNEELLKKLARIEEVATCLENAIKENNLAHERFHKEFIELLRKEDEEIIEVRRKFSDLYKKYFAARKTFESE